MADARQCDADWSDVSQAKGRGGYLCRCVLSLPVAEMGIMVG